jgi:hypothetical protein
MNNKRKNKIKCRCKKKKKKEKQSANQHNRLIVQSQLMDLEANENEYTTSGTYGTQQRQI